MKKSQTTKVNVPKNNHKKDSFQMTFYDFLWVPSLTFPFSFFTDSTTKCVLTDPAIVIVLSFLV